MLLDAHTMTKSFRDLQYDLGAFLVALSEISGDASIVVSVKWSDGSVSQVPTRLVAQALSANFPELDLDGTRMVPTEDGLHISNPISMRIGTLSAERLDIIGGFIQNLVADYLSLDDSVEIAGLYVDSMSAGNSNIHEAASVSGKLSVTGDLSVDTFNAQGVLYAPPMQIRLFNKMAYASYFFRAGSIAMYSGLVVSGPMAVHTDALTPDISREARCLIPIPLRDSSGSLQVQYAYTEPVAVSDDGGDIPIGTAPELVMLYPKRGYGSQGYYSLDMTVAAPVLDDKGKIVKVFNRSGNPVSACNAWRFSRTVTGMGSVESLNRVMLPPYSAVDFIFSYTMLDGSLYAYMLPDKALEAG